MKREEEVACEFLTARFGERPIYEPLGTSTPPDFSIGDTAFEVRRLNQRYIDGSGTNEGLEQVDFRLNGALYRELSKIPFSEEGGTVFWGSKFGRPLEGEIGTIVKRLVEQARRYYKEGSRKSTEIAVGGVTLDLFAAGTPIGKAFAKGYEKDDDSGGMFGDIYPTSIRLALEEKISKTKHVSNRFQRWVLVLIDEVFPGGMEPNDGGPLNFALGHFNSVVIINPHDATLALEYPSRSLKLHETIRRRAYELYAKRGREHGLDLGDWLQAEAEPHS